MVSHYIGNRIINRYYSTGCYIDATGSEIMSAFIERAIWLGLGYWIGIGAPLPDCILGWCQTVAGS